MAAGGPVAGEQLPALERCGSLVDTFMHEKFSKIGMLVGLNPWKTVWLSLFGALCCMSGFATLRVETRPENLWMPTGTEASDEQDRYQAFFDDSNARFSYVIAVDAAAADADDGFAAHGMLADGKLRALLDFHDRVAGFSVRAEGAEWDWASLCVPLPSDGSPCATWSALGAWDYDAATLAADADARATLGAWKDASELEAFVGGLALDADGAPASASALMISYVNQAHRKNVDGSWVDEPNELWEDKFLDIAGEYEGKGGKDGIRLYKFATKSWSDEFGEEIGADITLIIFAQYLVMAYVALSFANFRDRAKSHAMLTIPVAICAAPRL